MNEDNNLNNELTEDEIDQLNFVGDLSQEYNNVGIHPSISAQPAGGMVAVYFRYTPVLPPDFAVTNIYIFGAFSGGPNRSAGVVAGAFTF